MLGRSPDAQIERVFMVLSRKLLAQGFGMLGGEGDVHRSAAWVEELLEAVEGIMVVVAMIARCRRVCHSVNGL